MQELYEKWFGLSMEFKQFTLLDQVQDQEEEAGSLTLPAAMAAAESAAVIAEKDQLDAVNQLYSKLIATHLTDDAIRITHNCEADLAGWSFLDSSGRQGLPAKTFEGVADAVSNLAFATFGAHRASE